MPHQRLDPGLILDLYNRHEKPNTYVSFYLFTVMEVYYRNLVYRKYTYLQQTWIISITTLLF